MKRITFLCLKGLETFIDPIADAFDRNDDYVVNKQYLNPAEPNTGQTILEAIHWSNIVWFEWANEMAIFGLDDMKAPEILDKKVIVRLHSYEALSDYPALIKWGNVHVIIYVSDHIRNIVSRYFPDIVQDKSVVIPNGVDMRKFKLIKRNKPTKDVRNIAYVGYINHKKEPALALQIMAKLKEKTHMEYILHIAGTYQDKRYEVYMEHMIKELDIGDRIKFHGWVPPEKMSSWLKDKTIMLHTSVHEGHSVAITEAMARGIVPVIHNFYGAKEQYPSKLLYNTVDEAFKIIRNADDVSSKELRDYVIDKGWTFTDQMKRIEEVLDGI